MRFSLSLWLPAVACLAQAASETGHLMVFPAESRTKAQHRQITPDTARVLLASVMGLDKFHELGSSTQEKMDLVNVFQQQGSFASRQSAPIELILTYGEEALGMQKCLHGKIVRLTRFQQFSTLKQLLRCSSSTYHQFPRQRRRSSSSAAL